VFWTVRIPDGSVSVDLDAGTASIQVSDLDLEDYFTIANALQDGPSVDATVSYEVHWSGVTSQSRVRNVEQGYTGLFLTTGATVRWTGSNAQGFQYASSDTGQIVNFAQIGHERNGVFFS
jgi:hypothetical protein